MRAAKVLPQTAAERAIRKRAAFFELSRRDNECKQRGGLPDCTHLPRSMTTGCFFGAERELITRAAMIAEAGWSWELGIRSGEDKNASPGF